MPKPLVFMDVDGVINDLNMLHALNGAVPPVQYDMIEARNGESTSYMLYIPKYFPELMQELCTVAEVQWLTTWRHEANRDIRTHLGIDELPVIDGTVKLSEPMVAFKWRSAQDTATNAIAAGRKVYWVEDFGVDIQVSYAHAAGVICWDTSKTGYVLKEDNFRQLISECRKANDATDQNNS